VTKELLSVLLTLLLSVRTEEHVQIILLHNSHGQLLMEFRHLSSHSYFSVIVLEPTLQKLIQLETSMEISANTHLHVTANLASMKELNVSMLDKINSPVTVLILCHQTPRNHLLELSVKSPKPPLVMLILVRMEELVTQIQLTLLLPDTHVPVLEDGLDQLVLSHQLLDVVQLTVYHLEFVSHHQTQPPPLPSLNVSVYTDILELLVEPHLLDVNRILVKMEDNVLDFMDLVQPTLTACAHILGLDNTVNGTQLLTTLPPPKLQACLLSLLLSWPLLFK